MPVNGLPMLRITAPDSRLISPCPPKSVIFHPFRELPSKSARQPSPSKGADGFEAVAGRTFAVFSSVEGDAGTAGTAAGAGEAAGVCAAPGGTGADLGLEGVEAQPASRTTLVAANAAKSRRSFIAQLSLKGSDCA